MRELIAYSFVISLILIVCVFVMFSVSSDKNVDKSKCVRELNDLLSFVIEYTHTKVAKIIQTRNEAHSQLELKQLRAFLDATLQFITEGEAIVGKTFYVLRAALLVQAKGKIYEM